MNSIVSVQMTDQLAVLLCFAAQHKMSEIRVEPTLGTGQIGDAVVHAKYVIGKSSSQFYQSRVVIALALDCIEIGYVEYFERKNG